MGKTHSDSSPIFAEWPINILIARKRKTCRNYRKFTFLLEPFWKELSTSARY